MVSYGSVGMSRCRVRGGALGRRLRRLGRRWRRRFAGRRRRRWCLGLRDRPGARVIVCVTGGGASCGGGASVGGGAADVAGGAGERRRGHGRRRWRRRALVVPQHEPHRQRDRGKNQDQASDPAGRTGGARRPRAPRSPARRTASADAGRPSRRCRHAARSRTDRWERHRECRRPQTRPAPGRRWTPSPPDGLRRHLCGRHAAAAAGRSDRGHGRRAPSVFRGRPAGRRRSRRSVRAAGW